MTHALEAIRNVSFVGHPGGGKTSLVDALAHLTGASARKGSVSDKTSICDTEPEEQDKGHTLQLASVFAEKDGHPWTFLDTPGYPEFIADTQAAMWASDLVVGVVSCGSGVTFNLRKKLEAAKQMGRGRAIAVTHIDGDNADFGAVLESLREALGDGAIPMFSPDTSGSGFSAVSATLGNEASDWRRPMMDAVMDSCDDEALMERYLETEALSDDELHTNIPNAIAKGGLVPVFAVHPESGLGLPEMLHFLAEYAPSPSFDPATDADGNEIDADPAGELCGVSFAVRSDPHVGKIVMAKILRGTLGSHTSVVGPESSDRGEKLGGLFRSVGKKKRDAIESAGPGEIVCFSKVETVGAWDPFAEAGKAVVSVVTPGVAEPMVAVAVEPKSRADEQKIGEALSKLTSEDPTFRAEVDPKTRELVVRGMSDLHLQVIEARMKRRYGVEILTHAPKIAYRQTVTKASEGHHRHKKQSGGRGQFGECYIRVKPLGLGEGFVFADKVVGGSIPRNLIPAVEKGMREVVEQGILVDGEVVDVEVELYDGKFHAVDSDEASFKLAGARSFIDGFQKAGPILLEPVMELQISVPTADAGSIFSDITSQRRGHVMDQWNEDNGATTVIKANVPLSTVQTYHRDLKSQTAGEGSYTMTFGEYAAVPAAEQQRILSEQGKRHD